MSSEWMLWKYQSHKNVRQNAKTWEYECYANANEHVTRMSREYLCYENANENVPRMSGECKCYENVNEKVNVMRMPIRMPMRMWMLWECQCECQENANVMRECQLDEKVIRMSSLQP